MIEINQLNIDNIHDYVITWLIAIINRQDRKS